MKIEIPSNELRAALKAAEVAVATRTTKPALSGVKLEAQDDRLTVSGTDLEIGYRRTVPCVVRVAGACVVPAKKLAEVLAEVEGVATVQAADGQVMLQAPGAKYKLPTFDPDEVPGFPERLDGPSFTVDGRVLARAIDQAEWAANRRDNSPRYQVNALLVEAAGGSVGVIGTDLKAIGASAFAAEVTGEMAGVLLPLKAAKAVRDMAAAGATVTVTANRNEVLAASEGVAVWCRQVQGKFPDWKKIIPKKVDQSFAVNLMAFWAAVKRAAITSDDESKRVDLTFSPGKVVMVARGPETGASEVEEELPNVAFDMGISFDPDYLTRACKACHDAGCGEMTVGLSGPEKPAVFEWAGGKALVMPMTID